MNIFTGNERQFPTGVYHALFDEKVSAGSLPEISQMGRNALQCEEDNNDETFLSREAHTCYRTRTKS
jgi:hypothetical protein